MQVRDHDLTLLFEITGNDDDNQSSFARSPLLLALNELF